MYIWALDEIFYFQRNSELEHTDVGVLVRMVLVIKCKKIVISDHIFVRIGFDNNKKQLILRGDQICSVVIK